MAEEVETAPAETVQQPAPNPIKSQLEELGSFMTPEDRQELEKLAGGEKPAAEEQKPATTEKKEETPASEEKEEKTEEQKAEEKKVADKKALDDKAAEEKKTVLGLNKKKPAQDIVIENPEQILETIKSKFGQEYKEIKELPKFFESAQKWRGDSEKLKTVETKLSQFEEEYSSLPAEIHDAVSLFFKGEDYAAAFTKKGGANLTVPFEKQDKKALVNTYFPGKFTDEDFTDEAKSETLKMAQEAAEIKFKAEKQLYDTKRATISDNAQKAVEAQKVAVSSSVGNLKQRFPDMDEDIFNDVKTTIEGGAQKVLSFFFNPDGTIKPDAAIGLTMAKHYESIMEEAAGVVSNIVETKANEELLTRGADGPKPNKSSGAQEKLPDEIQKKIDEMDRIGKRTSTKTF